MPLTRNCTFFSITCSSSTIVPDVPRISQRGFGCTHVENTPFGELVGASDRGSRCARRRTRSPAPSCRTCSFRPGRSVSVRGAVGLEERAELRLPVHFHPFGVDAQAFLHRRARRRSRSGLSSSNVISSAKISVSSQIDHRAAREVAFRLADGARACPWIELEGLRTQLPSGTLRRCVSGPTERQNAQGQDEPADRERTRSSRGGSKISRHFARISPAR